MANIFIYQNIPNVFRLTLDLHVYKHMGIRTYVILYIPIYTIPCIYTNARLYMLNLLLYLSVTYTHLFHIYL